MNLLDLVFPRRCLGCGKIGKYFCESCRGEIKPIREGETICPVCEKSAMDGATHPYCRTKYVLDGLISFFHYDGIIRQAVKAIKYRFVSDLANEFINLVPVSVFNNITIQSYGNFVLVPIPLYPSRLRYRGFNQAEVLGRLLAEKLHVLVRIDILRRTKRTTPQVEMKKKEERLENMKNVFAIQNSSFVIHGSNILLFDDVFTTGATMRSAANVLKRTGVKSVWGITVAR